MICPCKGCPERVVGCHGSCERYRAFSAECERIRQARYQAQIGYYAKIDSVSEWKKQEFRTRKK